MTNGEKAKLDPLTRTLNISAFQKLAKKKMKQKNKNHALVIMDLKKLLDKDIEIKAEFN